jgi:zinc-binding alcohol dehydrogenase family protein
MLALAHRRPAPLAAADAIELIERSDPVPGPHDLLVRVRAVSVNPVDVKVRAGMPLPEGSDARVLGWDAAGTVLAVGDTVSGFAVGDRVWYAGAIDRPGSHAERQVVDHRLVGHMPATWGFDDAAALPLTAITAWELLFERLGVPRDGGAGQRLLVVGAAGGVGSVLVQLARRLTRLEVIGTASRPESAAWVREMGAHHVVDHSRPLDQALAEAGLGPVHLVASLTQTEQHYTALVEALAPQGRLALIDDLAQGVDVRALKRKSLSLHWEMMFTRSLYGTADMARQGALLDEVAALADAGVLRSTRTRHLGALGVDTLRETHALLESGRTVGKIVLGGFPG